MIHAVSRHERPNRHVTFILLDTILTSTGFLFGTLAIQQLSSLPGLLLQGLGWMVLAVGFGVATIQRFKTGVWPRIHPLLKLILWFFLGCLWAAAFASVRLAQKLPSDNLRYDVQVEGEIATIPEAIDRGQRFDFIIHTTLKSQQPLNLKRVRLSWYDPPESLKAGEYWQLHLKLRAPHGSLNPGSMDYEAWLYAEDIRAVGYVTRSRDNRRLTRGSDHPLTPLVFRQSLYDRLKRALNGRPFAGIIEALVMGIENDITQAQWDVLRRTGTTHLVAISGSHIGLIAGLTFFICRFLVAHLGVKRYTPHQIAAVSSTAIAGWYSALADFAIPTQRALVMICVVMTALLLRRNARPSHSLSLAALAVSFYDPLACLSPGFWLSFAAVALILYGTSSRLKIWRGGAALLRVNGFTALGLAPVLLLFFQQVSLISPVANAIAVPVLGIFMVPVCLVGALLLLLQDAWGTWVLLWAERFLTWFWSLLEMLSALPLAQWNHPTTSPVAVVMATLGVLMLLAPRGIPARWLGLVFCLPLVGTWPEPLPEGSFRLTLLDVGQGLSAVVETRHHVLVFDTGARFGSHFDMGGAVVEPYLRYRGMERIDLLMISHGDNDHIGGARTLLRDFPVTEVYSSVPDRLPEATAKLCEMGQSRDWDGVKLEVLGPVTSAPKENDNSCVLKIIGNAGSALLTGDIESQSEMQLVRQHQKSLSSTILVAPHHGSNTSSSALFLDSVQPDYALIPDGHLNRYGFPHPQVLHRYAERGIRVWDTAGSGALSILMAPNSPRTLTRYRVEQGHYWNAPASGESSLIPRHSP